MDSPTPSRHSGFSTRNSTVDVSQLDKVNAIPNKTADNVLLSNLCQEDQHYLKFLMENDSSSSEDEGPARHTSSGAWSPMVQSPMMSPMANKRKGAKSSYAITLSLEDISYIRPSWGISKGIRTIEVDGKKAAKNVKKLDKPDSSSSSKDKSNVDANSEEVTYKYLLVLLTLVVVFLTLPPYWAEQMKLNNQISLNRLRVDKKSRIMEIYRPDAANQPLGEPILRVDFARGVPDNLKPEECRCKVFENELRKRVPKVSWADGGVDNLCFSCLDWAVRANLRVLVEQSTKSDTDICYNIKWQSYDSLATPLIDCFSIEKNDQWFGLGDIHSAEWALNKLSFDWLSLATNLSAESMISLNGLSMHQPTNPNSGSSVPSLGSHANFTLISTGGIFVGELRSDFRLSVKVEQATEGGAGGGKRICIKASCSEKCGKVWSRVVDLTEFDRLVNNVLEYKICSSVDAKNLISRRMGQRLKSLYASVREQTRDRGELINHQVIDRENRSVSSASSRPAHFERLLEKESSHQPANWQQQEQLSGAAAASADTVQPNSTNSLFPESIGMLERTIFATSPEFMSVLDGKTLRQYVDSVVKMGLKTSLILSIDSRWETYIGSLQLNTDLFPKWRLLFEIIHNKGFKVILTFKPFVDTVIGAASVNQLFESGKLHGINSQAIDGNGQSDARIRDTVLRRTSLFSFHNETIEIGGGQNVSTTSRPYVFKCKESQVGYCVLLDLNRDPTRAWLTSQIARSELLVSNAADAILVAGSHPDAFLWDNHYREGLSHLVRSLFFGERIFTIPQWTGDLGYMRLASRPFTWQGLRSVLNSVLNLGLEGYSLIHPGSVWGDLKSFQSVSNLTTANGFTAGSRAQARKETVNLEDFEALERSNEELSVRWLQVSVFLPILQFNNLAPIERHNLQELLQNLVRIRKLHIIAELKKHIPYTPLISHSRFNSTPGGPMMPLIRPVWSNQQHLAIDTPTETVVAEQFSIGPDILVAPIVSEGIRQRDIYLPNGFWRDELRQMDMRGGKWLRNYPVELNEIAWFTRAKR